MLCKRTGLCAALLLFSWQAWADLASGVEAIARRDYAAALAIFKPLAEQGDVAAQVNLGNLYMKGLGVKQSYAAAQRWYTEAAEHHEPLAQTKLGILYFHGLGVTQDATEAARWFTKAAEQDETSAQAILGSLYAEGEGVPQDLAKAYYWYVLAEEEGNQEARSGRESLEQELTPGQRDEALRLLAEKRQQRQQGDEREFEAITDAVDAGSQATASSARAPEKSLSLSTQDMPPKAKHRKAGSSRRTAKTEHKKVLQ